MNRYFTAEADALIGRKVLEYNRAETDAERLGLEAFIKERTGILLYLSPRRNLSIGEEDLSGFYLDVVKDMDRIIGAFSISGTSYIAYLTQICRYRCMRYMRKKERNTQTEIALIRSDPSLYEYPLLSEPMKPYSAEVSKDADRMDLKGIIGYIIGRHGEGPSGNEQENALADLLGDSVSRRRFIEFLLHLPQVENASFISGVSRVLRVDLRVVSRFYELRRAELSGNDEAIESAEAIAARYWKIIANLRHAITNESDPEKLKELAEAAERTEMIYRRRLMLIKHAKRGFSHTMIARLFGMPRSTVSNDISRIKEMLSGIRGGMDY